MMSRADAFVLLTALVGIAANTADASASFRFIPKGKMHSPVDMKRTTLGRNCAGGMKTVHVLTTLFLTLIILQ